MKVDIVLSASGADPIRAVGELKLLSAGARAARAAGILLLAVALAAAIIPVPIIHLIGIPLILIAGLIAAWRQLRSVAQLAPIRMNCPRCGGSNSLGGGLGMTTSTGPIHRDCESCRRQLEVSFLPASSPDNRQPA